MTIKEADGSEQHDRAFASLPVLQREGRLKYALTSGQYRTYDHSVEKKAFRRLIYGLPAGSILYADSSPARINLALGWVKTREFGALSVDATQARAKQEHQPKSDGQSWRALQQKHRSDRHELRHCRLPLFDQRLQAAGSVGHLPQRQPLRPDRPP